MKMDDDKNKGSISDEEFLDKNKSNSDGKCCKDGCAKLLLKGLVIIVLFYGALGIVIYAATGQKSIKHNIYRVSGL